MSFRGCVKPRQAQQNVLIGILGKIMEQTQVLKYRFPLAVIPKILCVFHQEQRAGIMLYTIFRHQ